MPVVEPVKPPAPVPIGKASIFFKTVKFTGHAIKDLGALKQAMTKPSTAGYCEGKLTTMTNLANH